MDLEIVLCFTLVTVHSGTFARRLCVHVRASAILSSCHVGSYRIDTVSWGHCRTSSSLNPPVSVVYSEVTRNNGVIPLLFEGNCRYITAFYGIYCYPTA